MNVLKRMLMAAVTLILIFTLSACSNINTKTDTATAKAAETTSSTTKKPSGKSSLLIFLVPVIRWKSLNKFKKKPVVIFLRSKQSKPIRKNIKQRQNKQNANWTQAFGPPLPIKSAISIPMILFFWDIQFGGVVCQWAYLLSWKVTIYRIKQSSHSQLMRVAKWGEASRILRTSTQKLQFLKLSPSEDLSLKNRKILFFSGYVASK